MGNRGACKAKPRAWLALNVRTIRTEAVQGLDGYTIFRLPGSSGENSKDNTEGASEADGEGEKGKAARPGVDYMLWELASYRWPAVISVERVTAR